MTRLPSDPLAVQVRVLAVGPLPPPANGMTMITQTVLAAPLSEEFAIEHVDTSDHRPIANVDTVDFMNVALAGMHALRFAAKLLAKRPQIVYLPIARNRLGFLRDALFLLPSRATRSYVVVHLNATGFDDFYRNEAKWMRRLVKMALPPSTHAIVVGERLRASFPMLPGERLFVVPNGISDVGAGRPAGERELMVLHLATQWSEKGVFDVLEAAAEIAPSYPDARFVLAGGWFREEERDTALAFIEANDLEDVVELTGPVHGQRKVDLLRRAAVMVFPTKYAVEAHPLVVLEAMAAATPVVTTGIGAIPEMVNDGLTGVLVPPSAPYELASALRRLLDDPGLRSMLGNAARARYEEDFTLAAFQERLAHVWRRVVAGTV
jgi:glycosyltransferase involved in cell wall biosynthesis